MPKQVRQYSRNLEAVTVLDYPDRRVPTLVPGGIILGQPLITGVARRVYDGPYFAELIVDTQTLMWKYTVVYCPSPGEAYRCKTIADGEEYSLNAAERESDNAVRDHMNKRR